MKKELVRIGLSITEEMNTQLEELTSEMHSIKSEIIRAALTEFLEKHGRALTEKVQRGGERENSGRKGGQ